MAELLFFIFWMFWPIFIWAAFIIPYLKENGVVPNQTGANYGIHAWADWTRALEVAKDKGERKLSLYLFALPFAIIPLLVIYIAVKETSNNGVQATPELRSIVPDA